MREKALVLERIAAFRAHKRLEEVTAHKLLSNRRAPLGKHQCAFCEHSYRMSPRRGRSRRECLSCEQSRKNGIVHSPVREEVLVLGRKDRVPQNLRNVVILDNFPVFLS